MLVSAQSMLNKSYEGPVTVDKLQTVAVEAEVNCRPNRKC